MQQDSWRRGPIREIHTQLSARSALFCREIRARVRQETDNTRRPIKARFVRQQSLRVRSGVLILAL
jgi:hypothetical protein